jgi:hypothetical protein
VYGDSVALWQISEKGLESVASFHLQDSWEDASIYCAVLDRENYF